MRIHNLNTVARPEYCLISAALASSFALSEIGVPSDDYT